MCLAVTKQEEIKNTPNREGHIMIVFNPDPNYPDIIARSQATRPIAFGLIFPHDLDVSAEVQAELGIEGGDNIDGMFNYWVIG